ncbi:MAG: heme A synthase [Candidatus Dadabacteria bacterium]|nr:heme A synthase [Candidatus Dadabacteria bacterium]MYC39769.1 heme A synthase [Candidatus Dadabacteria bacterium]MYH39796.1 heme A synthase [Candidatus Dadabacteria bacterium]
MLAKTALALLFILLIWGNAVSGLKAGLACPDWPLCHGEIIPPFRWDIYVEFSHRVIGGITSIVLFILCYRRFRAYKKNYRILPLLVVLLLLFQIVLGGIVVLAKLPVNLTTIHFTNAIIIFSITLYMVYFDGVRRKPDFHFSGPAGLFFALFVLVFIQASLGAYVRHLEAGLACPDFPTCLGYWIPPELSGKVLAHFSHRTVAYLLTVLFIGVMFISRKSERLKEARKNMSWAVALLFLQIGLGILVVTSKLVFYVTAVHLAIGLLILSLCLLTWFRYISKNSVTKGAF